MGAGMPYKAAIFDLDGTLLDTLEDLADSMNEVLTDFGMPVHPADPYRFYVGDGMVNLARRAAPPGTGDETARRMAKLMDEKYAANWRRKTRPYAGVAEMLAAFGKQGVRMAVLSNKPDSFTRKIVEHFFPAGTFEAAFGARDSVPRKPDPAGAFEIARLFGLRPEEFLYLGDTNTDMQTGRAAGMYTVGVSWGFRPVEELRAAGAQAIIDRPEEALKLMRDS